MAEDGYVGLSMERVAQRVEYSKGTIYLLELQQQVGLVRPDVRFTGDEAQATVADAVLFQAMQSDYTELCWTLVQKADPNFEVTVEDTPVVLGYDRRAVLEAMAGLSRRSDTL